MSTQITLSKLITPITEDGIPDQRHLASLKRILQEIGEDTAKNLLQLQNQLLFFKDVLQMMDYDLQ